MVQPDLSDSRDDMRPPTHSTGSIGFYDNQDDPVKKMSVRDVGNMSVELARN